MGKKKKLTYYCDGGCSGNPGPGGCGVVRVSKRYEQNKVFYNLDYWYKLNSPMTTNNEMELAAVLHVLGLAFGDPNYEYEIYSDSAYVVNMCNDWIWRWAKQNWTRGPRKLPIENLEYVKKIYYFLTNMKTNVKILKCNGHSNILENELADALASNNQAKFDKYIKQYDVKIDF